VVRYLGPEDTKGIREHLLSLSGEDRYHRFHTCMDDSAIVGYVNRIDFSRMVMTGAFNERGNMIGLAEAHFDGLMRSDTAEVSVTVAEALRRRGIGRILVDEVQKAASVRGACRADFYFQPDNRGIIKLIASFEGHILHNDGYAAILLESMEASRLAPLAA